MANSSILGSLANGNTASVGLAPSVAMGMCYVAMANSMGIAMGNAVAHQQRCQVVAGMAVTQVLAKIIAAGSSNK